MSGMIRKCCPPVCCTGDDWTCDEDLVAFDITVHHEIKLDRTTDIEIENCCPDIVTCSPRDGMIAKHDSPLDVVIQYECRFKVYMTPPSGTYTSLYNLGSWVQSPDCDPEWLDNPTLLGKGPKVRGTWTSETKTVNAFPCGSGNCYGSSFARQNKLLVDADFSYNHPDGTIPPNDILSVIKLRNLPENHGGNADCCTGIKTAGCDDRCLIDLQVELPVVDVSMLNGGGNSYAFHELVNRLSGTTPACTVGSQDINQTYPAPSTTFEFYPSARKAYEGGSVNTCDPALGAQQAVAAVDSALATTWSSLKSQMQTSIPSFQDTQTNLHWTLAGVAEGLFIGGTNSSSGTIFSSTDFYAIGPGSSPGTVGPYDPDVICMDQNTEHNQCDVLTPGTSLFYIPPPPPSGDGICPKYKFNLANTWVDHIWEFDYEATWGSGPTSCSPCVSGQLGAFPNAKDETGVKLKTVVTVNSITPVDSGTC
jgi:hypothetical protein